MCVKKRERKTSVYYACSVGIDFWKLFFECSESYMYGKNALFDSSLLAGKV